VTRTPSTPVVQPFETEHPVVHRPPLLPQEVRHVKTLERLSTKLRDETDLEALNEELVGVVSETVQPALVSLWSRPETASKWMEYPTARSSIRAGTGDRLNQSNLRLLASQSVVVTVQVVAILGGVDTGSSIWVDVVARRGRSECRRG